MSIEQLDLLAWGVENPQPEQSPVAIAVPPEPPKKFAVGEVVIVRRLADNERERPSDFLWAGTVLGRTSIGMVQVNTGVPGNPYACSEDRLQPYSGVIALWRLGSAASCDRPDCKPRTGVTPFDCAICGKQSEPWWWYVGEMSLTRPKAPRWPDAVWFPSGYDPNQRRFEDE